MVAEKIPGEQTPQDWEEEQYQEWLMSPEGRAYATEIQEEFSDEALAAKHLICAILSGVRFVSRSNGRGRLPRRPRTITLLSCRNGWGVWSGEDRTDGGKFPWDTIAVDAFGVEFCDRLISQGIHPDDHVRSWVEQMLNKNRF